MSILARYSEPFNAECRAFGRLEAAGHRELATACFGYILLDEAHERALMERFHLLFRSEAGWGEWWRSRFRGRRSGKPPPIRGIVKALGFRNYVTHEMRERHARKILAFTAPHFLITPELQAPLTPFWRSQVELEAFRIVMLDYWEFDEMMQDYNDTETLSELPPRKKIHFCAFPHITTDLKRTPRRDRIYSLADPRQYDWKAEAQAPAATPGWHRQRHRLHAHPAR